MVAGHAFPFYSEARITFKPTYKYNNGTDDYDTSYVLTSVQLKHLTHYLVRKPGYRHGVIECCEKEITYDRSTTQQHHFIFPTIGLYMQPFSVL